MMIQLRYIFHVLLCLPLVPFLLIQGKSVIKNVPQLPDAKGNGGKIKIEGANKEEFNLMFIGESTIAGVGVQYQKEGLTGWIAKEMAELLNQNLSYHIYAASGNTVKSVLEGVVAKIPKKRKADLIILGIGANDVFKLNHLWAWKRDVGRLISILKVQYPNTPLFFLQVPPLHLFPAFTPLLQFALGKTMKIFGAALDQMLRNEENVYFASKPIEYYNWHWRYQSEINRLSVPKDKDGNPKSYPESGDLFSDGVHPSELTYQLWALDSIDFLKEKLGLGIKPSN